VQSFAACAGLFERFKGCHGFDNLKVTGKAAAADSVAAEKFPALLQATIERHGYLPQQVFILDGTELFSKQMPSRTFVSVQGKVAPGFKATKNHCTLLLRENTSRDYKIKPLMVYHSENLQAIKSYSTVFCLLYGDLIRNPGLQQAFLNFILPVNSIMN
jgi:hypothetical protein